MKKGLWTRRFKMVMCDIHNLGLKLRMLGRRVLLMLYASEPTLQKQTCSLKRNHGSLFLNRLFQFLKFFA